MKLNVSLVLPECYLQSVWCGRKCLYGFKGAKERVEVLSPWAEGVRVTRDDFAGPWKWMLALAIFPGTAGWGWGKQAGSGSWLRDGIVGFPGRAAHHSLPPLCVEKTPLTCLPDHARHFGLS